MRKITNIILVLLFFLSMFSLVHAWSNKNATELIKSTYDNPYGTIAKGWTSKYEEITLLAVLITIIITSLIYFGGRFFQNEQIISMGKTELMQSGVTILILIGILGFIALSDGLINYSADHITSPCLDSGFTSSLPKQITKVNQYAACYLNNLEQMSQVEAISSLRKSVKAAKEAYDGSGKQASTYWVAYLGYNSRLNAHRRLDAEVHGIEFNFLTSFIISIASQKVFLANIVPVLGPSALLLGLILRSLFFTRKLGGLLISTGIGLMIILPAAYLLGWFTIQTTAFGTDSILPADDNCPSACTINPPWAYGTGANKDKTLVGIVDKKSLKKHQVYTIDDYNEFNEKRITDGKKRLDVGDSKGWIEEDLQLCYPNVDSDAIKVIDSNNCPAGCRFFPVPVSANCNITACDKIPAVCKAIRAMSKEDVTNYCQVQIEDDDGNLVNKSCNSVCPDYCKIVHPFVTKKGPTSEDKTGIVNSKNSNKFTDEIDCTKCPSQCRAYTIVDDKKFTAIGAGKDGACDGPCVACMKKTDTDSDGIKRPDVMTGIPAIRQARCNKDETCGPAMTIKQALDAKRNDVCPTECRLYFEGHENLKDQDFVSYCEGKFKVKCEKSCPQECKIKVDDNLLRSITSSGCPSPPTFSGSSPNIVIDEEYVKNCARCPLQCRFKDPSSSFRIDTNEDYLKPAYYTSTICRYSLEPVAEYTSGNKCKGQFKGWFELKERSVSDAQKKPNPPACSPAKHIYRLIPEDEGANCPIFSTDISSYSTVKEIIESAQDYGIYPPVQFMNKEKWNLAQIRKSPNIAPGCDDKQTMRFCTDTNYCPEECIISREDSGPHYCDVDITKRYSTISDNQEYCKECATLSSDKTKGPQCQVYLKYKKESGIQPAGCDKSCVPQTTNPSSKVSCNGFCYPRLDVPDNKNCLEYKAPPKSESAPNAKNFEVKSCQACPVECRYDYNAGLGPQLSDEHDKYCGVGNYMLKNAHNCEPKCRGVISTSHLSTCQRENYSCTSHTDDIWVRTNGDWVRQDTLTSLPTCSRNIVKHISGLYSEGDTCSDRDKDNPEICDNDGKYIRNWYDDSCSSANFQRYTSGTYYSCKIDSRWPKIDKMIKDAGLSEYYECAEQIVSDNKDRNLCGDYTANNGTSKKTIDFCKPECEAEYTARAVECLPSMDYLKEMGTDKQTIDADENCQQCPIYCRVDDDNDVSICKDIEDSYSGFFNCQSTEQCDMRSDAPFSSNSNIDPNPPAYCAIGYDKFKIPETCSAPIDPASACPIRCRVKLSGSALSIDCADGNFSGACETLDEQCKLEPKDTPCIGCAQCLEDCTMKPNIWLSCSDVCNANRENAGVIAMTPADMLSSIGGAQAVHTTWRTIGSLAIGSVVLPIFSMIITFAFIRSLSGLLGGDIDIPGIMKMI